MVGSGDLGSYPGSKGREQLEANNTCGWTTCTISKMHLTSYHWSWTKHTRTVKIAVDELGNVDEDDGTTAISALGSECVPARKLSENRRR